MYEKPLIAGCRPQPARTDPAAWPQAILHYQALKSQPRSAHLISGDYYASLECMKQELDDLGFADEG